MIEYALYRGDTFLALDTASKLARRFHIKSQNLDKWTTPEHCEKVMQTGKGLIAVKLEPIYNDVLVNDEII